MEGRHIQQDDTCKVIISDTVAKTNHMGLGDTIRAEMRQSSEYMLAGVDYTKIVGEPIDLEIVGIFHVNFDDQLTYFTAEQEIADNMMFTSRYIDHIADLYFTQAIGCAPRTEQVENHNVVLFYVDNPEMLDSIIQEVKDLGIVDEGYYNFIKDDTDFMAFAAPLQSMVNISTLLIVVLVASCFLILSFLIALWGRSRQKEVGIFMSLGVSRKNIAQQRILEVIVIFLIAMIISVLIAAPLCGVIGNAVESAVSVQLGSQPFEKAVDGLEVTITQTPTEPVDLIYSLSIGNCVLVVVLFFAICLISTLFSLAKLGRTNVRNSLL